MGMSFQLSPGVVSREYDVSEIVTMVASSAAALVGQFSWGPVEKISTVSSEANLVSMFGKPDNSNFKHWFCAKNFTDYSRNLKIIRVVEATANNANAEGVATLLIKTESDWQDNFSTGNTDVYGTFAAKYPGAIGNSIEVHLADAATFNQVVSTTLTDPGTGYTTLDDDGAVVVFSAPEDTNGVTATGTLTVELDVVTGIVITEAGSGYRNAPTVTIPAPTGIGDTATATAALWAYNKEFIAVPGTSEFVAERSGSNDEMHMIIVDAGGLITGRKGEVLERYPFVSKASDALNEDGTSSYYAYVLRNRSAYAYWMDHPIDGTNWGNTASATAFVSLTAPEAATFTAGSNGAAVTNSELIAGWDIFKNPDTVDLGLLISGPADTILQAHLIQNVAEHRKDCVAFLSPQMDDVVYNNNGEIDAILTSRNVLPSSSYGVMTCNWKYQYDTYNDTFRWVPDNGDIAGLCAQTDETRDPWWSPAGYNRGHLKNVVKFAWEPDKTDRDELYPKTVNPTLTIAGEGSLLMGDRTMQLKPSAFDRINVRRLFIVLEKSIAKAAKYQLFEFNDEFTRMRFVQMVEPFLRAVQGARGIYDFEVVCDTTNNTPQVIDSNGFVGDIYIKPARSINYITLNFVATSTGVDFEEIIGKFG